ncbi:MAG TPA: tetratricopeptide repeat protein [Kofleriaceae bacterium]
MLVRWLPFIALGCSGCFWVTTRREGEALRRDVESLDTRISSKARAVDDQVLQLKLVVDEATRILKRNDADIGADVDDLRNTVRELDGRAAALKNAVDELRADVERERTAADQREASLEQRVTMLETGMTGPSSPDKLWQLGHDAFEAKRYPDAIEIFSRLASTYPEDARAPDALYFKGQAYATTGDWPHAIGSFIALYQRFPSSKLADDGLLGAAEAAHSQKSCTDARTYLGLLRQHYPASNVRRDALHLERELDHELHDRAKCAS